MAKTLQASLANDEARLRALQERIAAKKSRLTETNRKLDTRRKVLIGAFVLDALEKAPDGQVAATFKLHLVDFRGFVGERNESAFTDLFAPG